MYWCLMVSTFFNDYGVKSGDIVNSKEHTCCFFGHRNTNITDKLRARLKETIEDLIVNKKVDTFLFGSRSRFDKLCLEVVTELKDKYSIRRIYVRAEFPYIDEDYMSYLLKYYDHTYYPDRIINAGKAVYVERNYEMIEKSSFCIIFYDKNIPLQRKSGTKLAYDYAVKKRVELINMI